MRLTTIILIASLLHVSASTLAQKITLDQKNVKLESVLQEIRKQSGYDIYYDSKDIAPNQKISIHVTSADINEALNTAFKGLPLTFDINGTIISIKKRNPTVVENLNTAIAAIDVHGYVVDEKGQPLPGATVKIKNTNQTTTTDNKGYYSITVPDAGTIIVFSFVGYESQEIIAKDIQNGSSITLKASVTDLKEVVVNKGYYTTTQALNTGNVTTVKGEDMQKQPEVNPILALEGRVPGLYVNTNGGALPGGDVSVMLRGTNSIANGNDPFYIVDGVPFTSTSLSLRTISAGAVTRISPFNSLNLADIESIEVLKDADATAIYGSRGANGVILITTKKGKPGKTKFDASMSSGIGKPSRRMNLLNTKQYLAMRHEAFNNDGVTPGATDYDLNGEWDTTRYTNWQDVFLNNTAHYTNAQGSISGGNSNTQFLLGGSYTYQSALLPALFYNKKNAAHINISHTTIDKRFNFQFSASYINGINILPMSDPSSYAFLPPDAPTVYDKYGNLNWQNNTWTNPFAGFLQKATANTDNLMSNLNLVYRVFPGFELKTSLGYANNQMKQVNISPLNSYSPSLSNNLNLQQTQYGTNSLKTYIIEPQLHYNKETYLGHFDILLGMTMQQNTQNTFAATGRNYTSDALLGTLSGAASVIGVSNNYTLYRYNAFFSRVNYSWRDELLINLTGRRDGSSRFGPGKQFGNFGAIGSAWIFTKEKFFANNIPFFSFGKLRASYGITGNDQISDYQYLSSYYPAQFAYQGIVTLSPDNLPNATYGWELDKKLEIGLEFGFLKDRFQFSVSYFRNRTGNLLVGYSLPSTTGFSSVQANLPAVIQNTGLELTFDSRNNLNSKSLLWTTSFNLTIPRNKLVSYPNLAGSGYSRRYVIGQPVYVRRVYHFTGVDQKTGIYTFDDLNKDGKIASPDDWISTSVYQKYFGGIQNTLSYKGIQLSILVQFVKQNGNKLASYVLPGAFGLQGNQSVDVLEHWSNANSANSTYQKYSQSYGSPAGIIIGTYMSSDALIVDASFIRVKNIELSYSLFHNLLRQTSMKDIRVFCQMENVLTITKYKGPDPENQSYYPLVKNFVLGASFSF